MRAEDRNFTNFTKDFNAKGLRRKDARAFTERNEGNGGKAEDGNFTNGKDGRDGFSMVEMLMVIAIIGLLAGLVLGVMPGVMHRKVMARVETELTQLQSAIDYYKEKQGFYPPDNANGNCARPPLFYELIGTMSTNNGARYVPLNGDPVISTNDMGNYFGHAGFLNSGPDGSEVKNFYPTIRSIQYKGHTNNANVKFFAVPAKGPGGADFNPWRYVVGKAGGGPNPTNNPGSYDLWAEVVHGGRTNVIGNWKR